MNYSFGKVKTIKEYSGVLCGVEIKDKIAGCMTEVALSSFEDIFKKENPCFVLDDEDKRNITKAIYDRVVELYNNMLGWNYNSIRRDFIDAIFFEFYNSAYKISVERKTQYDYTKVFNDIHEIINNCKACHESALNLSKFLIDFSYSYKGKTLNDNNKKKIFKVIEKTLKKMKRVYPDDSINAIEKAFKIELLGIFKQKTDTYITKYYFKDIFDIIEEIYHADK